MSESQSFMSKQNLFFFCWKVNVFHAILRIFLMKPQTMLWGMFSKCKPIFRED